MDIQTYRQALSRLRVSPEKKEEIVAALRQRPRPALFRRLAAGAAAALLVAVLPLCLLFVPSHAGLPPQYAPGEVYAGAAGTAVFAEPLLTRSLEAGGEQQQGFFLVLCGTFDLDALAYDGERDGAFLRGSDGSQQTLTFEAGLSRALSDQPFPLGTPAEVRGSLRFVFSLTAGQYDSLLREGSHPYFWVCLVLGDCTLTVDGEKRNAEFLFFL